MYACNTMKDSNNHESILFNENWKFILGDSVEYSDTAYNDHSWRALNLPHDWGIEGGYDQLNHSITHEGHIKHGIGWYRKQFQMEPEWEDKNVTVVFEGVYMNNKVFINGIEVKTRPYGYSSFAYNITPHLVSQTNTIAVRVDNSKQPVGRIFTSNGIYRHVWLKID